MTEPTDALSAVLQLIELETDPIRRAGHLREAAQISLDQLLDRDQAVEYLDQALDSFCSAEVVTETDLAAAMETFAVVETILTSDGKWRNLDRAYRKMIVRVRPTSFVKVQVALWLKLGELYRDRLDSASAAEAAFEQARQLEQ